MHRKKGMTVLLIAVILLVPVKTLLAYDGNAAASYADSWALSYNTGKYPKYSNDCTNFVSQCLFEGGKAMDYSGTYQWWLDFYNNWTHTHSWTVAMDFYNWMQGNPAGSRVYFYNSYSGSPPNYVSSLQKGGRRIL